MIVRYSSPFQELDTIRRQFDRMFNDLAPTSSSVSAWTPGITLRDRGNDLELSVQLPGMTADDIEVQATRDTITIAGESRYESQREDHKVLYNEVRYGSFRRVVTLPIEVQHDAITADYTNGVLTLTLPKVVAEQTKVVKVALNGSRPEAIAQGESADATAH